MVMGTTYNHRLQLPLDVDMYAQTRPMINYSKLNLLFHKTALLHLLPSELHNFLERQGVATKVCETFYTPPFMHQFIHRDTGDYQRQGTGGEHKLKERKDELLSYQAKLNWCYDEFGGTTFNDVPSMAWWATEEESADYKYRPEQCTLLEKAVIYQPSLVRIDVPHSALNDTHLGRWCISLTLGKVGGGPLLWNEAEKAFSQWFSETPHSGQNG